MNVGFPVNLRVDGQDHVVAVLGRTLRRCYSTPGEEGLHQHDGRLRTYVSGGEAPGEGQVYIPASRTTVTPMLAVPPTRLHDARIAVCRRELPDIVGIQRQSSPVFPPRPIRAAVPASRSCPLPDA